MPRLFVSIELPEDEREALDDLCEDLPDARWTAFEQMHLTLAFLGEVDGARALDLDEELAAIRAPRFELRLHGVGFFPPRGEPRVLWAGFDRSEPLTTLQRQVARAAERAGCEIERRKFHPHVTLARLRDAPPDAVAAWLASRALFRGEPFEVRSFCLFSSVLGRDGAAHSLEREYELG